MQYGEDEEPKEVRGPRVVEALCHSVGVGLPSLHSPMIWTTEILRTWNSFQLNPACALHV